MKPKPFACPECEKRFSSEGALLDHRVAKHGVRHPKVCEDCGWRAPNVLALAEHRERAHPAPPACIECGAESVLVSGKAIYPHRPDLHHKYFYRCRCGAYCGCHPGTAAPLGFPCGPETRKARSAAHAAFDPLWRRGELTRQQAYAWLSEATGIPRERCHIGMMTADQARLVVRAVRERERVEA